MQKKKETIYSQGKSRWSIPVMYRIKIAFTDTHTHAYKTIRAEDKNFSVTFFIQLIHFLCFYQGCDSTKKAKTSS